MMDDLPNAIERCENRASVIENKLVEVTKSVQSVRESCTSARLSLDLHYEKMKMEVMTVLEERYHLLAEVIDKRKTKDLESLTSLQSQLQNDLSSIQQHINKAKESKKTELGSDYEEDDLGSTKLIQDIHLCLDTLSRSHSDIPCSILSVNMDEQKMLSLLDSLKNCIEVDLVGGLHITDCIEMPGGILVKWDEPCADAESVDTDNSVITRYTLQYSSGSGSKLDGYDHEADNEFVFNTIYTGDEMQYLVCNVEVYHTYYFRVCRSRTGTGNNGECEPWSMPKKGITTLSPFEWNKEDCHNAANMIIYELGNKNRTATKVFPQSCIVLRSNDTSYRVGHQLNFNIDEAGENSSKDGIGLLTKRFQRKSQDLLIRSPHSIVVNTRGLIYVNGSVMVMKLPAVKRGSTLTFQTNRLTTEKLRVTISNEDKEVTFDWPTGDDDNDLIFAASFEHTGWQVTVF